MKFADVTPGDIIKVKGLFDSFDYFLKIRPRSGFNVVSADSSVALGYIPDSIEVERIGVLSVKTEG